MEKKFYLSSGLEVIQDEFILHTPDYGFTAGIRKNWGSDFDGYTSFRFRNEILDNYWDVINSGVVETLFFDYDKDDFTDLNLANIDSLKNLKCISFSLEKKASISLDALKYRKLNQLSEISLKGTYAPGNFLIEQFAAQLGFFEASFDIFKIIYKKLASLKTLRLIGSEKEWTGEEFNCLKSLKRIHLDSCSINSLEIISNLQDIQILILAGCKNLTDISNLSQFKNLQHLVILDCPKIKNWNILKEMPLLRSLRIKKTIDFPVVENLPGLRYFSIDEPKKGEIETWTKNPVDKIFGKVVNADMNILVKDGLIV